MPSSTDKPNRKAANAAPPAPAPIPEPSPAPKAPSAMSAPRYSAWTVVGIVLGILALVAVAGLAGATVGYGYGRAQARAVVTARTFGSMMPYGFVMPHGDLDEMPFGMMGRLGAGQAFLGVTYGSVDADKATQGGLKPGEGAQISAVSDGSPAAQAGLQAGDIILAVDGTHITQTAMLRRLIQAHQPGDQVTLLILRNGSDQTITVKLGQATDVQTP